MVGVLDMNGYQNTTTAPVNVNKATHMESISSQSDLVNTLLKQLETVENQKRILQINNEQLVKFYQPKAKKKVNDQEKSKEIRVSNYDPPSQLRAIGNIWIKREMRDSIIPSRVDLANISDLYLYLDKLTALQWNQQDDIKYDVGDCKVLDYDLHDEETGEPLYCVVMRQDETLATSRNYNWKMDKKLYTKSQLQKMDIMKVPNLRSKEYAVSVSVNTEKLNKEMQQEIIKRVKKASLNKIKIYDKQNVKGSQEIRWTLNFETFRKYCQNNTDWRVIPIIMEYDNEANLVQYLVIIKTEPDKCNIGISVKFNASDGTFMITGFHIDKKAIELQHHAAMPYPHNQTCKCLDSWNDNSIITHLTIGNPNENQRASDTTINFTSYSVPNVSPTSPSDTLSTSSQYSTKTPTASTPSSSYQN